MDFSEIGLFPKAASTLAPEVDALFWYITAITVFFTLLVGTLIFVFMIRYRRRHPDEIPEQIQGSLRLELAWTIAPLLIAMTIFVWGAVVYVDWAQPPADTLEVYVVGRQWMWHLQHPGGQREINQLHVPVGRPVKVTVTSQDVIHNFFVPAFRSRVEAIPGRYTTMWFEATQTGEFDLFCTEYCGTNHSTMIGKVVVLDADGYQRWLNQGADNSLATEGRKLFQKLQCVGCHTGDGRAVAPVLENLYMKRVPLHDGGFAFADENYLRESIRNPNAKVVAGYQRPSIMPIYGPDLVSEQEMIQLLAFLRSLGAGQTPPRVEDAERPAARPGTEKEGEKQ